MHLSSVTPSSTAPSSTAHRLRLRVATLSLLAVLPVAACGAGGSQPSEGEQDAGSTPPAGAQPSSGNAPSGTGTVVAENIEVPWGLAFLPDGSSLVSERETGRILQMPPGGGTPREVQRVPEVDTASGEGGLLGLAVSPRFAEDRSVYAYYTAEDENRIVRFRLGESNYETVFAGLDRADYHNGGRIAFGPDGMLYVATGDAGERDSAQDQADPNGKILRLAPDGSPAPGNPTPGSPVYSLGHRNVQGLAWDRSDRLYAIEFGQNQLDEVNVIEAGRNYGWPEVEGVGDTAGGRFTNPIVTWDVAEASPSGATIVGNDLYVAALRGERLWRVPLDGRGGAGEPEALLTGTHGRLRTVVTTPDGALWFTTSNRDGRGDAGETDDRILRLDPR